MPMGDSPHSANRTPRNRGAGTNLTFAFLPGERTPDFSLSDGSLHALSPCSISKVPVTRCTRHPPRPRTRRAGRP